MPLHLSHRSTMTLPSRVTKKNGGAPKSTKGANVESHTSFQGMIANSQNVLDIALRARENDSSSAMMARIPSILFRECQGIILLHVMEAAFVFGASVGTGLLMKHDKHDNTWSAPSAVGLTGVSWGFMGGIARKDLVVFVMDDDTMSALSSNISINLGGQASLTVGDVGREVDTTWHASNRGVGATVAFSYSRGFMVGISLEGSVVATRQKCNAEFYNQSAVSPAQILNDVQVPESVKALHMKLETLAAAEPPKRMREPIVLYQQAVATTQTGDYESEDETLPGMEPPVEIISSISGKGVVITTHVETQTDEDFVLCQIAAQTQTGQDVEDDDIFESPILVHKKSMQDFIVMVQAAQTQTDDLVMVQAVQTQTGEQTGADEPTVMEQKAPTSLSATFQVAETQTQDDNEDMDDDDDYVLTDGILESEDEEDMEFVSSPEEIEYEMSKATGM